MTLILIIFCIWGASALVRASKEVKAERERERLRREQAARSAELARMTAEWKQRQAEAKIETARLIAVEREQMRLAKEQEKQAAQLAKHEKRLADLEFRMSQAESDIEFFNGRIAQLDAQRDYLLLQQSGTIPGGKEHTKYQTKIISIENQIHTAENKLNKAQHTKAMAQREMEVA
jgi:chromosome segregation ATPase